MFVNLKNEIPIIAKHLGILEHQQLKYAIKIDFPTPIVNSQHFFRSIRHLESYMDNLKDLNIKLETESTKLIKLNLENIADINNLAFRLHEDFLLLGEIKRLDLDLLSLDVRQSLMDLEFDEEYLLQIVRGVGPGNQFIGRVFSNACGYGQLKIVEYMINDLHYNPVGTGRSFSFQDSFDNAFRFKHPEIIRYLLHVSKVDPNVIFKKGIDIWKDARWNKYNNDDFRDTRGFEDPKQDYSEFWNVLKEVAGHPGLSIDVETYLPEAEELGDTPLVEFVQSLQIQQACL
ncbi:hypothetical protein HDV01_007126 [Terramyces sp. JEL0728]|nr:hypothetical protein HDV01_007126 [Terramyces sp. JEL0728]